MIFDPTASDRKVRVFSLSPTFIDQFKGKQPKWGFQGLGYFTFKRTYARDLPDGTTEEWWNTCQRVVEGTFNIQKIHCRQMGLPWKEDKAQASAQDMFQRIWDFKFTPPGRGLWVMGTDLVYDRGAASLMNCFSGDTEIITSEGVKAIGSLVGTNPTLLTKNGKWVDAPIRSFGIQKLWKLSLRRRGVDKVIFCTKDHRWFSRDLRDAKGYREFKTFELKAGNRLQCVFGQGIEGGGSEISMRHWVVKSVEETDRVEEVFCATVKETGAFALEGNILTGNCGFTSTENINEDFSAPFCFLMDMSMLGVGVGGDTRGVNKVRLGSPKITEETYVVADSREGWVDLLRTILNSFVGKTHFPRTIDYSKVRTRGTPIKTFGGIASGPKPLHLMIESITRLLLPNSQSVEWDVDWVGDQEGINLARVTFGGEGGSYRISSTQIVDIFNFIGKAVVAGGVRRTAEIMFGDPNDLAFMNLKQDKDALNDRRWASNNSIFAKVGMDYSSIVSSIAVNGEPGVIWLDNIRKFSRMGDPIDNKDRRAMGTNPCGEQPLESFEMCCLVETYPAHHESYEDFERTLKMAYLYAKTVTLVPTHDQRANAVMMRNRRIGCSMSGITQALKKFGRRKYLNWCDQGYHYIRKMDHVYSDWLGTPLSIKTTSVKPSGTVSLLCGATPGIHYPHSEYYIRHVRVANTSPLVEVCKKSGYQVDPDPCVDDTSVVGFPVHEEFFLKGKNDVTVWEQFANAVDIQRYWADNQVSVTVTFRKDEVEDLRTCLEAFETSLKGLSMLPVGDEAEHGYKFPPYQSITKDQYESLMSRISPLNFDAGTHDASSEERFCTNDTCTLKPASK